MHRSILFVLASFSTVPLSNASPTGSPSLSPNQPDFLDPRFLVEDPSVDGGNMDNTMIGPGAFKIPNSDISVSLDLQTIVSPRANLNILNATAHFLDRQLVASGDGQLPQSRDPFIYDLEQGMYLNATSVPGQHLCWSYLNDTLGWLLPHLAAVSKYRQGGHMFIYVEPWGTVGWLGFYPGFSGVSLPTILPGAEGVTQYS